MRVFLSSQRLHEQLELPVSRTRAGSLTDSSQKEDRVIHFAEMEDGTGEIFSIPASDTESFGMMRVSSICSKNKKILKVLQKGEKWELKIIWTNIPVTLCFDNTYDNV